METNIILISILVIINILTEVLLGIEPRLKASKALFLTIRTQDHITNKWGPLGIEARTSRTQSENHTTRLWSLKEPFSQNYTHHRAT